MRCIAILFLSVAFPAIIMSAEPSKPRGDVTLTDEAQRTNREINAPEGREVGPGASVQNGRSMQADKPQKREGKGDDDRVFDPPKTAEFLPRDGLRMEPIGEGHQKLGVAGSQRHQDQQVQPEHSSVYVEARTPVDFCRTSSGASPARC